MLQRRSMKLIILCLSMTLTLSVFAQETEGGETRREKRQERHEMRKERREDRREKRKENREDRREARKERRQERRSKSN